MLKSILKFFADSLGPGIPEPEPYELSVTDELRKQAITMVTNGSAMTVEDQRRAQKILLAFQLDSEQDRAILHRRLRRVEMHWVFRPATIFWVAIALTCLVVIILQHLGFYIPLPFELPTGLSAPI